MEARVPESFLDRVLDLIKLIEVDANLMDAVSYIDYGILDISRNGNLEKFKQATIQLKEKNSIIKGM